MSLSKEELTLLLAALRGLRDPNLIKNTGICGLLMGLYLPASLRPHHWAVFACWERVQAALKDLMSSWPLTTEDSMYPIPHPLGARVGFDVALIRRELWDKETEYGRLRWALLGYLIERVETALGELQ